MATIALGIGALAAAGAGAYGASEAAGSQRDTNRLNAQNYAENRRLNTAAALQDALNSYENLRQRAIDNRRYDEAQAIEQKQRDLTNRLATATTIDQDGNTQRYDPVTGTWTSTSTGVGLDNLQRQHSQAGRQYSAALASDIVGGQQAADRRAQAGSTQLQERALGQALLGQYAANQGRSRDALEGALITSNVANATDALQRNGGMAQLAGWRQGNSGSDALIGALARNGQTGTRAAIASARVAAPQESLNERDMAAKSILAPATTLNTRGSADLGSAPVFQGSGSGNLLGGVNRGNAAAVGTTLNPRSGGNLSVGRPNQLNAYTPLNASGNGAVGIAESLRSLLSNKQAMSAFGLRRGTSTKDGFDTTTPVVKPELGTDSVFDYAEY